MYSGKHMRISSLVCTLKTIKLCTLLHYSSTPSQAQIQPIQATSTKSELKFTAKTVKLYILLSIENSK